MIIGNLKFGAYFVTHRGTLLMEIGLLHVIILGFFSIYAEKYYFCMEGNM